MQNKKLITGIIIVVAIVALVLVAKSLMSAGKHKSVPISTVGAKGAPAAKMPAKKMISKGKGALTVKLLNSKNAEIPMKIKMFKAVGSDSSVYAASTVGSRTQELMAGTYDIEIDTVPQKIIKNIKVNDGKETVKDLGCVTGSLTVRVVNSKKTPAYYPLRILYGKTNEMVTAFMTNKSLEIIPGTYDIEIGTSPRQYKKDVKVEAGKETIADLGCLTGTLTVKTTDENGNEARASVRILKTDTNEMVSSIASNKPTELIKGKYNVEVMSSPRQSKKDVVINTGEESVVEFTVAAPKAPAPKTQPVKAKQ
jgi:hypothetical protein